MSSRIGSCRAGGGNERSVAPRIHSREKSIPGSGWILRKIAHAEVGAPPGKGCYWDEHELIHPASNHSIACPQWEWAELDGKRLVWAAEGKLKAGQLTGQVFVDETLLFDFNEMSFAPIEAPY